MAIDASNLLARVCAIEVEALLNLPTPIKSNAVPKWLCQQETLPYWRNRIASFQLETSPSDDSQEMDVWVYVVGAQLVMAHYSEGYNGEVDEAILAAIPQVNDYFDARELLQSNAFAEPMKFLRWSWSIGGSGYETLGLSAAGAIQVGPTFQFRCVFDKYVEQAYLGEFT